MHGDLLLFLELGRLLQIQILTTALPWQSFPRLHISIRADAISMWSEHGDVSLQRRIFLLSWLWRPPWSRTSLLWKSKRRNHGHVEEESWQPCIPLHSCPSLRKGFRLVKVEPCNDLIIQENILLLFLIWDCLIKNSSSDILNLFLVNKKMERIFNW